ncbi:MAG: hypothetical protein JNM84_22020 [Planctomycetes bacterium]|nr:hypothetical protein [Planctomycetota bacterium]
MSSSTSEPRCRALVVCRNAPLVARLSAELASRGVELRALEQVLDVAGHLEPKPALVVVDLLADVPDPWHRVHRMVRRCREVGVPALFFASAPVAVSGEGTALEPFDVERLLRDMLRLLGLQRGGAAS